MTKRDNEDAGLALVSGGIGALFGYGAAKPKIEKLEAEKRQLQVENTMLRNNISQKDNTISQLQTEVKKLKEEIRSKPIKSIKSIFDKI